MALPSDYISGTITLTNGSTAFTGTGTGWLAADFREGDIILDVEGGEGAVAVIASITSNTAGVLSKEWEGPTLTGVAYRMRYQWDSGRVSAQSRAAIEMLGNGNLQSFASLTGPGVPVFDGPHSVTIKPESDFVNGVAYDVQVDTLADRDAYDGQSEGFAVLVSDVGDGRSALYSKESNTVGDWGAPAYITGPVGPLPDVEATVTSIPPGSTATVTPTPISGGVRLDFELPEASGFYNAGVYNIANPYNQDDVVRFNGSSFIALQSVPVGESPSSAFPPVDTAYWAVLAAKGQDGNITGVTPFWQSRILNDVDAPAARAGLGGIPYINKSEGLERVLVGGLIQSSDSSGWQFVADATHASAGFNIGTISTNDNYIHVEYEVVGSQVRTLLITVDDAYSMRGLTVGASVGLGSADIYLGLPLVGGVQINSVGGNVFYGDPAVVHGLSVISNTGGRVVIEHGPISDQSVQPVLGSLRGGWDGTSAISDLPSAGILEVGGTGSGNRFDVQNAAPMSAKVRWVSGTTFAVDTDHAGTFTATWNAGTSTLTVVHPRAQSLYDFSATTLGNKLFPSNVSATGFNMQFQNSAGTILTTPDAFFNFHFTRTASFQRLATFPNRFFSFTRGHVRVNPKKVYGGGGGLLLWGLIKG